jgi:hypothetical protein
LQGQRLAELRLAARSLEEDDEVACHGQGRGTAQILFHQRQRQIDAGRYARRRPDRTITHEDRVALDPRGREAPGEIGAV